MIINLIFSALIGLMSMLLNLIPDLSLSFDLSPYIDTVSTYIGYVDMFISVDVVLFCITSIIVVDNFGFLVRVISFIWSKIPFIGG